MKLRHKATGELCSSSQFNTGTVAPQEIIVHYPDGSGDSDYAANFECWLEDAQAWQDLVLAFRDGNVCPDDRNERFYEYKRCEVR